MTKDKALKGAIGAEYQKSPWDGKGISMPPPAAPVQEPEYVYTCNGCDTLYREDDVSCDCTVHGLMQFTRHILMPDTTAAPVQEPVKDNSNYRLDPPEAEPAQRQWVGLTDEEFEDIEIGCRSTPFGKIEAMQKVEAKLRSKNT
jgi:hypothetical protein